MNHCLYTRCVVGELEDGSFSGGKNFSCYPPLIVRVASLTPSNVFRTAHPTVRKHENFRTNTAIVVIASYF
jgi:hypothetical protein